MKHNNKRIYILIIFGTLAILATLFSIYHLSEAATQPELADPNFTKILTMTTVSLSLLLLITLWQISKLIYNLIKHRIAAKLTLSFALRMLFLALIPIGIIGVFSWILISYDLGKSFNSRVINSSEDALQLTRTSITLQANEAVSETRRIANIMSTLRYTDTVSYIEQLRRQSNAVELAEFDYQGNLIAFANENLNTMSVTPPSIAALVRVNQEQEYYEFSNNDDNDYTIKVLAKVYRANSEDFYVQAVYAVPAEFNSLANSVRDNYQQLLSYTYLQPHITTSILLVLVLILVFTVLAALWISSLFAELMVRPVRQLIKGTQKVIKGDFSSPIKTMPKNDLGLLGNNFNIMLKTLKTAENNNHQIQSQLSEQNDFLETLLDNISAGVLTFDSYGNLITANRAAETILNCELKSSINLKDTTTGHPPTNSFEELIQAVHDEIHQDKWIKECTLNRFAARKTLICKGSQLAKDQSNNYQGVQIIVFEDVTEFQRNQRNAAWEEVAKRLAHEIKNPLTPIRLQSERLQRKLSDKLDDETDQKILKRATHTITNQVDAMQRIVSDFTQFAKPIESCQRITSINAIIKDVAELYSDNHLQLELQEPLADVCVDSGQIRQVIINLTKNAIEATCEAAEKTIIWRSYSDSNYVTISVEDSGTGFDNLEKDPFEPYVTNKAKGTGLGLAIVKKIINEHQGSIDVGKSSRLSGAKIYFTLPIREKNGEQ